MNLKNKNMLIAGDFFEQTKTLYPESIESYELTMKSKSLYSDITKQISRINDDFRFDFTAYPALTITDKDSNVLAFAVHPSLRKDHIGEYGSAAGVFNSAFENSKLFDQVSQAISIAGGDVSGFSVRQDLGEHQEVAKGMFRSVLNGTQNANKFQYLNDLFLNNDDLAKNYENYLENEREAFMKKRESAFVTYGDKDIAGEELKIEHDKAKAENAAAMKSLVENTDPNKQAELNKSQQLAAEQLRLANDAVHRRLNEENKVAGEFLDWHKQAIKDKNFRLRNKPVYGDKFSNIQDVIVSDENYNELYRFRAGISAKVRFTPAGLMNADARAIGQEYMIRRKASPININLPDPDSKSGLSNAELMSFMKNSVIEFHKNWDVPFEKLRVPKAYQQEFELLVADLKAKEALETAYSVGDPDAAPSIPAPEPKPAEPAPTPAEHVPTPAEPVEKPLPVQPEPVPPVAEARPEPAVPAPTESLPSASLPVANAPKPDAEEAPAPAEKALPARSVPVADVPTPDATPAPAAPVKQPEIPVSHGLTLVESKSQAGRFVLWGKESYEHTEDTVKKGIGGLCKHFGIEPKDIAGQWMTSDEKLSLNPKKSGGFLLARTVVADLVNDAVLAEKKAQSVKHAVVDKPNQYTEFDIDEKERAIANLMGTPQVLNSPENHERVAIRNESKADSGDNEVDNKAALKEFDELIKELDNSKNKGVEDEPASKKQKIKFN
ncbi:hypothetical protein V4100_001007 [Pseudomonas aeruginosa]